MNPRITRISGSRIVGQQYETNTQNKARHRAEQRSPLAGMFDGTEWHTQALCRDYPSSWWFPEVGGVQAREAKAVCAVCPVATECLEWALANTQEYGIFAQTNFKERKRIKARRKALGVDGPGDPLSHGDNRQRFDE